MKLLTVKPLANNLVSIDISHYRFCFSYETLIFVYDYKSKRAYASTAYHSDTTQRHLRIAISNRRNDSIEYISQDEINKFNTDEQVKIVG